MLLKNTMVTLVRPTAVPTALLIGCLLGTAGFSPGGVSVFMGNRMGLDEDEGNHILIPRYCSLRSVFISSLTSAIRQKHGVTQAGYRDTISCIPSLPIFFLSRRHLAGAGRIALY